MRFHSFCAKGTIKNRLSTAVIQIIEKSKQKNDNDRVAQTRAHTHTKKKKRRRSKRNLCHTLLTKESTQIYFCIPTVKKITSMHFKSTS